MELLNLSTIKERKKPYREIIGIYFLFDREEIIYIGKSKKLLSTISYHGITRKFDSFSYVECRVEHLKELELVYLKKFRGNSKKIQGKTWGAEIARYLLRIKKPCSYCSKTMYQGDIVYKVKSKSFSRLCCSINCAEKFKKKYEYRNKIPVT